MGYHGILWVVKVLLCKNGDKVRFLGRKKEAKGGKTILKLMNDEWRVNRFYRAVRSVSLVKRRACGMTEKGLLLVMVMANLMMKLCCD